GATVFFSSHQIPEVERIADYVVMIRRGQCVMEGALDDIRERFRRVRCVVDRQDAPLPAPLAHWRREGRVVTGFSPFDVETLSAELTGTGVQVLESEPATLRE